MSPEIIAAIITGLFVLAGVIIKITYDWITGRHQVKIVSPKTEETISSITRINGTFKRLPEKEAIWIVVSRANQYYPMPSAADLESKNKWSSLIYVGDKNDTGKKFQIIAILADKDAQKSIEEYNAKSKISGYMGLSSLPPGAREYHRIEVVRGPS
ncbi:MAG: hypothetical protein ABSA75_14575 [Candidatus Bathyarchaeia archaeon]